MADFTEIWNLRNKLILDGFYGGKDPVDGLELERKISALAYDYYDWEPPKPKSPLNRNPIGAEHLAEMTPMERIDDAIGILQDWDGYRSLRGLGELVDEVRERLAYPRFEDEDNLIEKQSYLRRYPVEEVLKQSFGYKNDCRIFDVMFLIKDFPQVCKLCKEHDLKIIDKFYHHSHGIVKVRIEKNEPI